MSNNVGGIQLELILSRASKVYHEGETISGFLRIQTKNEFRHEGIVVSLQGGLTTQPMYKIKQLLFLNSVGLCLT